MPGFQPELAAACVVIEFKGHFDFCLGLVVEWWSRWQWDYLRETVSYVAVDDDFG